MADWREADCRTAIHRSNRAGIGISRQHRWSSWSTRSISEAPPRPREEKLVPRPFRPRQVRPQDSVQLRCHLDRTGMPRGLEIPILVRSDVYCPRPQVYVSHPKTEHLPDPGTGEGQDGEDHSEMAKCLRRLVLLSRISEDRRDLILRQDERTFENWAVSTHRTLSVLLSHGESPGERFQV